MNIGAGRSVIIEEAVAKEAPSFVCDRVDVESHPVSHPSVRRALVASVESMEGVSSSAYDVAFANYVLEHVADLAAAAKEIRRVLKPGGAFVMTVPNPQAPEFVVSRHTKTETHQRVKGTGAGREAFETHYAYKSIEDLKRTFEANGFSTVHVETYAFTEGYLHRFPVLATLSRWYDRAVGALRVERLKGQACLEFMKR